MSGPFEFSLAEEEAHFQSFRIPTGDGELDLFGPYDLEQDAYNLTLTFGSRRFSVAGTRAEPKLSPVE